MNQPSLQTRWGVIKAALHTGWLVSGRVLKHEAFGYFVDIGDPEILGLVQITDVGDQPPVTSEDYPPVGEEIAAVVLGFRDSNHQVWLSTKPSVLTCATPTGFRASVIELLRTLASRESQEQYQQDVPIANVSAELVCGWFDDLYHPTAPGFAASFNEAEREALADFHRVYGSEVDSLPKEGGIEAFWESPAWERIGAAAERILRSGFSGLV